MERAVKRDPPPSDASQQVAGAPAPHAEPPWPKKTDGACARGRRVPSATGTERERTAHQACRRRTAA